MLKFGQEIAELADMVVIHKRHRAYHLPLFPFGCHVHELVADEVADRLGAVYVALLGDQLVELLKQAGLDGYPEARQICHATPPLAVRQPNTTAARSQSFLGCLWRRALASRNPGKRQMVPRHVDDGATDSSAAPRKWSRPCTDDPFTRRGGQVVRTASAGVKSAAEL